MRPDDVTRGDRFIVVHCKDAMRSYDSEISRVKAHERDGMGRKYCALFQRLAAGGRLSSENFPPEGELPNGKRFYAVKRIPLRAYYWKSDRVPNTYFVSHYVYKDFDKLDQRDIDRVQNNWRRIERDMEDM